MNTALDLSKLVRISTFARLYEKEFSEPISKQWISQLIRTGKIKAIKIDNTIFINKESLKEIRK